MAARGTRKQLAPDGETAQEAEARQRWVNNLFGYWHICAARVCKRKRCCAGDPDACFERWWWMTPERPKVRFRAYIKANSAGLSPQDALREAEAEVERAAEHIARVDAQTLAELEKRDAAMAAQQTGAQPQTRAPLPASRISSAQPPSPRSAGRGEAPRVRAL